MIIQAINQVENVRLPNRDEVFSGFEVVTTSGIAVKIYID